MCVASQMAAGVRVAGTAEFAGIQAAPDHRRAFVFKKALKACFQELILMMQSPGWDAGPHFLTAFPVLAEFDGLDRLYARSATRIMG